MKNKTRVFKFGGASVKDAAAFYKVLNILRLHNNLPLVMILSAMGKMTNALESLTQLVHEKRDFKAVLHAIIQYHEDISNEIHLHTQPAFQSAFSSLCQELTCHCHNLQGQAIDRIYGHVVSMGERLSSCIMHHFLSMNQIDNTLIDAREVIHTDLNYREGEILWKETEASALSIIQPLLKKNHVVLSQGFIGAALNGEPTTLGREGSDFTASILGSILDVESVTFWKDVPGVLNADPKFFPEAQSFCYLPYSEAIELSYYGAKVLHPKTIKPLQSKDIPLLVKSFDHPDLAGTLIQGEGERDPQLPSIILKHEQILFSLFPRDFSFIDEARFSMIFKTLSDCGATIDLMQNSALSFSFITARQENLPDAIFMAFSKEFQVRYNDNTSLLTIRHYTDTAIQSYTRGFVILLAQQTRHTYQAVILHTRVIENLMVAG